MLSRAGRLTWALSVAVLVLRGPAVPLLLERLGSPTFPVALSALLELALLAVAAPTAVVLGLALGRGPTARRAGALVPRALRGLLVAGVAGAITTAPAHAERDVPEHDPFRLHGLTLPDRPVGGSAPAPARTAAAAAPDLTVVVRAGDTLWGLAAEHLGPDATDAEVAADSRRWHDANRDVVGSDPDLLLPGQRLTVPGSAS